MEQPQRNRYDDCDVIFRIGNRSFMACREVLIQKVKYFESMFTLDMKEKNEFIVHLDPEVINPHAFDAILNFIYSSKINISVDNVKALYRASDFLCFTELSDKIVEYMNSDLTPQNVPTFMTVAKTYKLTTLEESCKQCILANPNKLSNNGNGLVDYLNYDELAALLGDVNMGADTKFNYVVKWILVEEAGSRREKLIDLLRLVQLEKLSPLYLKTVVAKNVLVLENVEALQYVLDATINKAQTLEYSVQNITNRAEQQAEWSKKSAEESAKRAEKDRADYEKRISGSEDKINRMNARLRHAGIFDFFF